MLQQIRIKNFQSLHDLNIEFGKFTVIIGPSSSGKSAFIRALKAVASNSLNSDYITQGTKHSSISLSTDKGTVTIERSVNGSSSYKVAPMGKEASSYTKLNRQVPTEVTEVLGISPYLQEVGSINFAGQFDPPYLLKDSASNVARILGELTNVSTIFAAVKEANRQVKNSSTILNLRKKDMEKVVSQISGYQSLKQDSKNITEAEERLEIAQELTASIQSLQALVSKLEKVENLFVKSFDVPDIQTVIDAAKRRDRFVDLLKTYKTARDTAHLAETSDLEAQSDILSAEDNLHRTLVNMGQCPLCSQEISI